MSLMAAAMQRAGLATEADVERVQEEKRREERYVAVLGVLPQKLAHEMADWMEEKHMLVPIELFEAWARLDVSAVQCEWAKWLSAWSAEKEAGHPIRD